MSKTPLLVGSQQHSRNDSYGSLGDEDVEESVQEAESGSSTCHTVSPVLRQQSAQNDSTRPRSASFSFTIEEPSHRTLRRVSTASGRRLPRPNKVDEPQFVREIIEESSENLYRSTSIDGGFIGAEALHVAEGMPSYGLDDLPVVSEGSDIDFESPQASPAECGEEINYNDPIDNSPYAQVRASVSATDNTSLSINTPRMWILSLLFAMMGSATNLFFSLRYPSVTITPVIALLLVHPIGIIWDQLLKRKHDPPQYFVRGTLSQQMHPAGVEVEENDGVPPVEIRGPLGRFRLWLAQGRWNEKEHACVYISSNVSFGFAFATDVIVEQTQFYQQEATIMYQLLLILSTQILGYAIAGLTRRYLVRPSGMIWPANLMATSMFTTLHKEENKIANGWLISRWKFFMIIFLSSFAFYFLPGLLIPALSYFNVITWFAPNSVVIANLFGVTSGLGLFPLTLDWSQIAYIGSPLLVPFWAALNVVGGLVLVMFIIAPILYYMNTLYTSYMPILSSSVFDNTGVAYDVRKILTPEFLFDEEAYRSYSQVFLPITYILSYALQFAAVTALLVHTVCWHGKDVWRQGRKAFAEVDSDRRQRYYEPVKTSDEPPSSDEQSGSSTAPPAQEQRLREPELDQLLGAEDVHNRLMRRYDDVPISWYLLTGLITTAIGIFVVEYYPVHLPWYGLLLALTITTILFIPIGIVMATTNQQSSLYLIHQLTCGLLFPGRGVANMVFVTYGYITSTQGLKFASDLKLGHYMKLPPRLLFTLQAAATVVASCTQLATLTWLLARVPHICTPAAPDGFTCPIARVHFNGSILWGVVGPARFFGPGALYRPLVWAFLLGAVAPLAVWLLGRRSRSSLWRRVNLPVVFGSLSWIPPATGLNFGGWALVCFAFNYVVKTRAAAWWRKYNFTLSAALDAGVACGVAVVFFGFVYPGWMDGFEWWGTTVFKQGCDWKACAYKQVEPGGHFGPETW